MNDVESPKIVINSFFVRNILVFPDVNPDDAFWFDLCESSGDRFRPVIVEAEAIDQSLVFREAKKSRPFISLLRFERNRAQLDKPETQSCKFAYSDPIFIKTRCDTEWIFEGQTKPFDVPERGK